MTQAENTIALKDVQEVLLDQPDFMRDVVSSTLQKILDTQFAQHLGAYKYERSEDKERLSEWDVREAAENAGREYHTEHLPRS